MRLFIGFRLRVGADSDLIAATADIDDNRISDMARDGLRKMLGLERSQRVEVPAAVVIPVQEQRKQSSEPIMVKSTPVLFIPKHKRSVN